ncbi:MAG: NAD-dependent epimerase/dehydratase family protein, partial [Acidimicrobiia bacterium]
RQRSDMAFHRWISAALAADAVPVFGDGTSQRDYTYVGDVVAAILASVELPSGTVANVAGGNVASINDVLGFIGDILGKSVAVERLPMPPGDPARTGGDTALLRAAGWKPRWALRDGVAAEIEWLQQLLLKETAP